MLPQLIREMPRRRSCLAVVLLLLMLLPACGGDVSSSEELRGSGGAAPEDCTGATPSMMVALPEGFSIDATEVSRCQYQAWLDTLPSTAGQDPWCSFNTDFTPQCQWPPGEDGNFPVVCVDWCDAFAYCKALGKRLCGKIGGGPNAMEDLDDPTKSQWYAACSSGGKYAYPYGHAYDDGKLCNDADRSSPGGRWYAPVGSLSACQSTEVSYAGVFDLSGNVWEWEDSCEGDLGLGDYCRIRGGSCMSPEGYASCGWEMLGSRGEGLDPVGFRCCLN